MLKVISKKEKIKVEASDWLLRLCFFGFGQERKSVVLTLLWNGGFFAVQLQA
jgi:hypothetical protein